MSNQLTPFVGTAKTLSELLVATPDLSVVNKPTMVAFACKKAGKTFPKDVRPSLKRLEALGVTKEQIKAWRKEHDAIVAAHHRNVRGITALVAADDSFKQTMKVRYNKAGTPMFDVAFRKLGAASIIKQLTAKIAELEAKQQPAPMKVATAKVVA